MAQNREKFCSKLYYRHYFAYGKDRESVNFRVSGANPCTREIAKYVRNNLFSESGKRKITMDYLSQLSPFGLAVWWMDDGSACISKGNRWGKLSTNRYSYEDNLLVQKYFKQFWDIDVQVKLEKGKYYFIYFGAIALQKLCKIIYPYVCEVNSMIYKVDLKYKVKKRMGEYKEVADYISNLRLYNTMAPERLRASIGNNCSEVTPLLQG